MRVTLLITSYFLLLWVSMVMTEDFYDEEEDYDDEEEEIEEESMWLPPSPYTGHCYQLTTASPAFPPAGLNAQDAKNFCYQRKLKLPSVPIQDCDKELQYWGREANIFVQEYLDEGDPNDVRFFLAYQRGNVTHRPGVPRFVSIYKENTELPRMCVPDYFPDPEAQEDYLASFQSLNWHTDGNDRKALRSYTVCQKEKDVCTMEDLDIANGFIEVTKHPKGKLVCDPGYEVVGNAFVECQCPTGWNVQGKCVKITCPFLKLPNGNFSVPMPVASGTPVGVFCAEGYTAAGPSPLECLSNGQWNGAVSCVPEETSACCGSTDCLNGEAKLTLASLAGLLGCLVIVMVALLICLLCGGCSRKSEKNERKVTFCP